MIRTSSTTTRDRNLQFRGAVSTGGSPLDFLLFSSIYVQFSKTNPVKSGESSEKSSGENRVKSCHVCGCHGFFGPEMQRANFIVLFLLDFVVLALFTYLVKNVIWMLLSLSFFYFVSFQFSIFVFLWPSENSKALTAIRTVFGLAIWNRCEPVPIWIAANPMHLGCCFAHLPEVKKFAHFCLVWFAYSWLNVTKFD